MVRVCCSLITTRRVRSPFHYQQVRYELTGATLEEAHRVLRQFVSGLLTGVAEDVKPKMIQADLSLGGAHCRNVMNYIELFRQ